VSIDPDKQVRQKKKRVKSNVSTLIVRYKHRTDSHTTRN
jgi:hypothetical protein